MKIAVGLSGGVDSSVSLALLQNQGHDVFGLTMKIWDGSIKIEEGAKHACYGPGEAEDIEVCTRIAKRLDVPYKVIDLSAEYNHTVIDYFRSEYEQGRTPNPCVKCNHTMKFGFLLEKARALGLEFDRFATGHYANIETINDIPYLKVAIDSKKDQTYFLYRLSNETLNIVLFPLGGLTKAQTRDLATKYGLEVADKPESQDFVAGGDYTVLFDKVTSGDIVDENGKKLGEHNGIIHYTIGQRKGLGIGSSIPYYVKEIDADNNRIIVTRLPEHLLKTELTAQNAFLKPYVSSNPIYAKIRYNHIPACVEYIHLNNDNKMTIEFTDPERSVTPGQAVVLYQDGYVIGGGDII